jgi:hypothetical protein
VDTFTGVSDAAITRFGDGVRLAVAKMAHLAAGSMAVAAIGGFAPVASAASTPVAPRSSGGGGSSASPSMAIEKGAITIVQQPGESGDALAQRVMKLIEAKYRLRG